MLLPLTTLKGVGAALQKKLAAIKLYTLQDLLFLLPKKYVDKTKVYPLNHMYIDQHIQLEATVISVQLLRRSNKKQQMIVHALANGMKLRIIFFHFQMNYKAKFTNDTVIYCFGELKFKHNGFQMVHPEIKFMLNDELQVTNNYYTPVYPLTAGLSQNVIYNLMAQILDKINLLASQLELLPSLHTQHNFMSFIAACNLIHQPTIDHSLDELHNNHQGIKRLALEELIAHRVTILQVRNQNAATINAPVIQLHQAALASFLAQLEFKLTTAQLTAIQACEQDFNTNVLMQRLLQGDVGSGKTIVSFCVALHVLLSGYQVALMVPTEVLAKQHYVTMTAWCHKINKKTALLLGKMTAKQKEEQQQMIATGAVQFVIGTHALFQHKVQFHNLGLVIIDEQHRFGVEQRLALQNKALAHQLTMTATPIPRSLAMILYADMDYTAIDKLPEDRIPIQTVMVSLSRKEQVLQKIQNICAKGNQVYWVCTVISESDFLAVEPVEKSYQLLQEYLPHLKVGFMHGQMHVTEKEAVMQQFKDNQINILVATTVIEVGVNVPNATLIVIENPERFGLSQLHQLRGRVGRSNLPSYCVLLYSNEISPQALQKLDVLRKTTNGFEIAEADLNFRGAGELLGTKQTGLPSYKIADLIRDKKLFPLVTKISNEILTKNPNIIPALTARWLGDKIMWLGV